MYTCCCLCGTPGSLLIKTLAAGRYAVDAVTGFDVVNIWQNATLGLRIVHVNATSYPDLFWALRVRGQDVEYPSKPLRKHHCSPCPCVSAVTALLSPTDAHPDCT